MSTLPKYVHLLSRDCSVIFDCRRHTPSLQYFGKKLSPLTTNSMLSQLTTRQEAKCALVEEVPLSLSPCVGNGFTGHPGVSLRNENIAWSVGARLHNIEQNDAAHAVFHSVDKLRGIKISHHLEIEFESNVLQAKTTITNLSDLQLTVDDCAAPTIPIPDHFSKILGFEGRWAGEFQTRSIDLFLGAYVRENRKGKTSHDNFPGVILHQQHTNERQGECFGFHLGWSGNHRTRVELLPEQRTYVQMAELLGANEVQLEKQQSYTSPTLYASYSAEGLTALSQQFHRYVRKTLLKPRFHNAPRPIHYNTWEAIYFNHDFDTLISLADLAAHLGAERFVLDDGWFKGRRCDKAGLGDWCVDPDVYPDGIAPLIDHVVANGMTFGIWFEPEMVNPDSDLFRAHPDWVMATANNPQINFRNQLVLDLSRDEVTNYLFAQLNQLLNRHPQISYLKWDMNRDINHSGSHTGKSAVRTQTLAAYRLIERLKVAHPNVEIESCSSGGGRIDFGMLRYADRVWTSDSNDALDRLNIQNGFSFFLPTNLMGSHVGPRNCHITGRHLPIETRIASALFGHMGMEMDPRELTELEQFTLKQGFQLHKRCRDLIHQGDFYRIDPDGNSINFGVVNAEKSHALFAYNSVTESRRTMPPMYRFVGLHSTQTYTLKLVWPTALKEYSRSILSVIEGQTFSGEILMDMGMQLPIIFPQTSLIFELKSV